MSSIGSVKSHVFDNSEDPILILHQFACLFVTLKRASLEGCTGGIE
jgi:hypothetical protein